MDYLAIPSKELVTLCRQKGFRSLVGKSRSTLIALLNGPPPPPVNKKSRGGNCLKNGLTYETLIKNTLSQMKLLGFPITCEATSGAAKTPDIPFIVDNKRYSIEAKRQGAFEAGGKAFQLKDGVLSLPLTDDCKLHRELLPADYKPFNGLIPSFKKGDKTVKTWIDEKHNFPEERIACDDTELVAKYYNKQGSHYIQIENYGLYHTGEDVLQLGVPLFKCAVSLRVRCKQHGSSCLPGSVQVSINYDKKTLVKSPYDITQNDKLPPKLTF
jgi:hypothetical protein